MQPLSGTYNDEYALLNGLKNTPVLVLACLAGIPECSESDSGRAGDFIVH